MCISEKSCKFVPQKPQKMKSRERFERLLTQLKSGVYEKDTEIGLSLLAALAGESVLLLGPPGVAKSMVARRVKSAFREARSFEYLMSRFSTPDEIFGPVSISRLKSDDIYERNVQGFMPTADIVFLDEIWKAGPAILNTLLTIINEKTFRNGISDLRVPLKLLIGASNELPADGEGLEALWDRFLVRIVSHCVENEQHFYRILLEDSEDEPSIQAEDALSPQEYAAVQQALPGIGVEEEVLNSISFIRKNLGCLRLVGDDATQRVRRIYVSDRRWKHIARLLRASAYVHGRSSVQLADLLPLVYCLWNDPEEIAPLRTLVVQSILSGYETKVKDLESAIRLEMKRMRTKKALQQVQSENYHRDDNKQLFDGFNYLIDGYGNGSTFIFFVDYKNMKDFSRVNAPLEGVVYQDPHIPRVRIIRTMSDAIGLKKNGIDAEVVKLYRDNDHIYINGVQYLIHQLPPGQVQPPVRGLQQTEEGTDFEERVEELSARLSDFVTGLLSGNLFAGEEERRELERQQKVLSHEIALLRIEIQKMLYE